jgi:leucyl aminopeptidase
MDRATSEHSTMEVALRRGDLARRRAGAIAIGIPARGRLDDTAATVDRRTRGVLAALVRRRDFAGKLLETAVLYPSGLGAPRLIAIGLGDPAELDPQRVRLFAAQAARRARELGAGTLAIPARLPGGIDPERTAQCIAEGAVLGHYRFTSYRTRDVVAPLRRIEVLDGDREPGMVAAVERGARWAEATCLARDLANTPGHDLTPEVLARQGRAIAGRAGARITVLDVPRLERIGMGALLAVGRGSVHPPRFLVLEHEPAAASRTTPRAARRGRAPAATGSPGTVVVIGKGVTFDSGGISIKPRENMHRMKYDMSGAAAVLGLFSALPSLSLPFRVVGLIPCAENMPGGRAMKPGDVVRTLDGTTVEIINTDAEGRLVLADAITYARRYRPQLVVDLATLTGAVSVALGRLAAGLFTADDRLGIELSEAAAASGERLWRLPLWDEYAAELRSETADLVNSASGDGAATLGAMFLRHFATGMRWAHLDIASTAWSLVERPHEPRGATGFGVRLMLEWLSRRASGPPHDA